MKVNLIYNQGEALNGYQNVDLTLNDKKCSVSNFDLYVDDAEAEELRAINVLNHYPPAYSEQILKYWIGKLKHGGKIVIGLPDLYEICRGFTTGKLDVVQANQMLYGLQTQPWELCRATYTLDQIVEFLQTLGLRITKKRINNFQYIVEAQRR